MGEEEQRRAQDGVHSGLASCRVFSQSWTRGAHLACPGNVRNPPSRAPLAPLLAPALPLQRPYFVRRAFYLRCPPLPWRLP